MTTLIALAAVALTGGQATNIENYVQSDLQDATLVARIIKGDQRELAKINKDFGTSYRFDSSVVYFKEPLKMRAEAHVEETNVIYIINGATQWIKLPSYKYKTDLTMHPGRRQSLMDVGVLVPSLFTSFMDAKFIRMDRETGEAIFDLTYKKGMDDSTRYRVWLDKSKKYVTKREWYNQFSKEIATFYYLNPVEVKGVWFPTRLEVKNTDNVIAGITKYDSMKINTGLPDSMFVSK